MKSFSDKSLFRMRLDESLILLFGLTCKIVFVVEHFKYYFRKSFMASKVALRKTLTLIEFGFASCSLFSSIL